MFDTKKLIRRLVSVPFAFNVIVWPLVTRMIGSWTTITLSQTAVTILNFNLFERRNINKKIMICIVIVKMIIYTTFFFVLPALIYQYVPESTLSHTNKKSCFFFLENFKVSSLSGHVLYYCKIILKNQFLYEYMVKSYNFMMISIFIFKILINFTSYSSRAKF